MKNFRFGLKFAKKSPLHFIGHLDLMRLWERAFRRAGLPGLYSEGYNPHPKISLAQPLAVGVESEAEYLEFYLSFSLTPDNIKKALADCLPPGITIEKIFLIPERLANLTVLTDTLVYEADFDVDDDETVKTGQGNKIRAAVIKKNIEEFLSGQREVQITLLRKGEEKVFPLNPYDYQIEGAEGTDSLGDRGLTPSGTDKVELRVTGNRGVCPLSSLRLRIKYREGVPLHALEILKAVTGAAPQKVTRKEIVFKFNFK